MAEDAETNPPPSRGELAHEDFLFHLYRGSELLQDNHVHEAKLELEHALSLSPRDAKSQDLLGIVYFRLGLYPRAISIYEVLIAQHPKAATPRINLALCYLKTGQAAAARDALERVLELNPNHARAWGYLGLAFQRLGDYERACHAFQAGGHDAMALRLMESTGLSARQMMRNSWNAPDRLEIGRAASEAFEELDRPSAFTTDAESPARTPSGSWAAVEPGLADAPPERRTIAYAPAYPDSFFSLAAQGKTLEPGSESNRPTPVHDLPTAAPLVPTEPPSPLIFPRSPSGLARDVLLVFPREKSAAVHPSGVVLLRVSEGVGVRLDVIRTMTYPSTWAGRMLMRRTRGRELDEPLGGVASPLFEVDGAAQLVLGPPVGTRLFLFAGADETLSARENALVCLERSVAYENGRLPGGEGDSLPMVQCKGTGTIVLALPVNTATYEIDPSREVLFRAHTVLGWTGRVTPRVMAPSEAPATMRGFIALSGEGLVFVDGR